MAPRYKIGQKVIIMQGTNQRLSPRDSDIEPYIGKSGTIVEFYWIKMHTGAPNFYIYTVLIESEKKEVVVHEDEIEAYIEQL